ncbi:hypothetical protein FH508_0004035 [Lysinibacillus sp. CD3-6]|uniref:hypothetical protein n=1 Tax=Lysinibacillus sp. CD3-6 TaxID=2892541 RepID=UPI00116F6DCA|nr:hypothetical protein [Lysinibacillus sp. CD3-6]UED81069.1 hypothetical protein FH508_0004035 [Lysinibacillus sp. CD3-6]
MTEEIHDMLIEKYEETGSVYSAFHDFYSKNYLSSMVIQFIENQEANNELIGDENKKLEIKYLVIPKVANAIFLTLYSDFEYFLINLCKAYKETLNLRLKFSDLKGDGIIGALNYLDRVVGIEVKNNNYYQELPHWNKIRNVLIHNSGIIEKESVDSIDRLNIKSAHSLGNELITLSLKDVERFILITENIQKYLIKR